MKAGELVLAFQFLVFQPGLRHVQQVQVIEEIRHALGEHQQRGGDLRLVLQAVEFGRKLQQQRLRLGVGSDGKAHSARIDFAAREGAQIQADDRLFQPLPGAGLHRLQKQIVMHEFHQGFFLRLLVLAALPELLSFLGPL